MFGSLYSLLRTMFIASHINARFTLRGPALSYSHPVENQMMDSLRRPGIRVHWGVYMSGKSSAVKNAGFRLQEAEGRLVIVLDGLDFSFVREQGARAWLCHSVLGAYNDETEDISKKFNRPTSLVIDHFEYFYMKPKYHALLDELLVFLRELNVGVLLIVSSWERAMELRQAGCELLGDAGCGRWTEEHLREFGNNKPEQERRALSLDEESMRLAVLSGSPLYLVSELNDFSAPRAVIQDVEWANGIKALETGVVETSGFFPDKNGKFHWTIPPQQKQQPESVTACMTTSHSVQ